MLTYKLDVEERSTWIRTTPGEHELAQPFWATEEGAFYAHREFFTERTEKDSYELFYTFDGEGTLEQNVEVRQIVTALEEQYDAMREEDGSPLATTMDLPTADEIGDHFERFLADQDGPEDPGRR